MHPISRHICPTIDDAERSYTGMWSRSAVGIGGSSALVNGTSQAFIHFLYDDQGNPRWLLSAPHPQLPTVTELSMRQFTGFCAVCDEFAIPPEEIVGVFTREFSDESHVTWTMDYVLNPPLSGSITRTDEADKFTDRLECK